MKKENENDNRPLATNDADSWTVERHLQSAIANPAAKLDWKTEGKDVSRMKTKSAFQFNKN